MGEQKHRSRLQSAESFQALALDLLQHGQLQMALSYCRLSLQAEVTPQGYKLLGDCLQRLGQLPEAEAAYRQALQLQPDWAEVYANLGSLYAQQQQWLKSLFCYRRTLVLKPELTEIHRNIERLWDCIGRAGSAVEAVYEAFLQDPQPVAASDYLELGNRLLERNCKQQAVVCYRQALNRDPQLAAAQRRLEQLQDPAGEQRQVGQTAGQNGRLEAKRALKPDGDLGANSVQEALEFCQRGHQHRQRQQWQQAVACYEQAIRRDPQLAEAHWYLAKGLERLGQLDAAVDSYFQALSLQSNLAGAAELCRFGELFVQRQQSQRALACFEWAVQQDGNLAEAHYQRAELLQQQQQYEMAVFSYRQAMALRPSGMGYHQLGDVLQRLQQWPVAAEAYEQAIELEPNFSWSHNNLGDVWMQLKQWQAAASAYERAIQLNPDFYWSHYNLGEALARQNQWEAAIQAYQRAEQLDPTAGATEKVHQVRQQRAKADLEAALDYYRRALEQNPHNLDLLHQAIEIQPHNSALYLELAQGLARQGQWDQATVCYGMALQLQPELATTTPTLQQFLTRQRQVSYPRPTGNRLLSQDLSEIANWQRAAEIIEQSGIFDETYYLSQRAAMNLGEMSALQHYLQLGASQGYNPNPFFDSAYYLAQNLDVAQAGVNPLAHYLYAGAAEGRDPHPLFETAFYLVQHPEVAAAEMNPLVHYVLYGVKEGRVALSVERILATVQDPTIQTQARYLRCLQNPGLGRPVRVSAKVGVYCSAQGNYFMAEIADFIAAAFEQVGVTAVRLCETDQRPDDLDFDLIVAPHEFFYLGAGESWQQASWLSRAVMVNVEQPHTTWFAKAFCFLRQARLVLDINVKSAAILEQLGIPAYFLPLSYLPDYAPFGVTALPDLFALQGLPQTVRRMQPDLDAPLETRPLDLHFIGTLNPRREQFLAESAAWLSRFHCFFHIPPLEGPLLKGQDQALDTQAVIGLSQRSKILLNLHREDLPYFEWHRIVFHGLWQKTLVVTEPCHGVPGLIPGEHFIECKLSEMGSMVDWLLNTPTGRAEAERIRQAGHRALQQNLPLQRVMQNVVTLLAD